MPVRVLLETIEQPWNRRPARGWSLDCTDDNHTKTTCLRRILYVEKMLHGSRDSQHMLMICMCNLADQAHQADQSSQDDDQSAMIPSIVRVFPWTVDECAQTHPSALAHSEVVLHHDVCEVSLLRVRHPVF